MKLLQNLLVGTLFFGALSTVGYFTIFSERGPFAQKGERMVLYFDNADGLKVGSKVVVLGVPNGTVTDLSLVAIDKNGKPTLQKTKEWVRNKVAVTIEVKQPIIFYENYKIEIKSQSLLSGKLVAIDPGSAYNLKTQIPYQRINVFTVSAGEIQKTQKSALALSVENSSSLSASNPNDRSYKPLSGETSGDPIAGIAGLIEENKANVTKTIQNIADITEKIKKGEGTVGKLIYDDELHKNANTLLTDAEIVIKELRESLEDTREQAPVTSMIRAALTAF